MIGWLVGAAVGILLALLQYGRTRTPPLARGTLALMRAMAVALVVALLLDAPVGRARPARPWVFVDASQSMMRADSALWRAARDTARGIRAESTWIFGDTVRADDAARTPSDPKSRVRPVVERTIVAGRPVVIVTDGEVQDSSALDALAGGSRVVVLARGSRADAAVMSMEAPRAIVEGDSLAVRVTIGAGGAGAGAGTVSLLLNDNQLGRWPLEAMSPWGERQYDLRVRIAAVATAAALRVALTSVGDAEPRNDTLGASIDISRAASAVFVSTSPDQDARFALGVLRGALALPTRGFLRVAPGNWRQEGTLAPVTEAEVRQAVRDAPVVIIHGDTAIFGAPQTVAVGPLALMVPPDGDDGEWYPSGAPMSPLSSALAAVPLESLPPVSAGTPARGEWTALEARRGREATRRPLVVGRETPRRVVTVTGSGFWRWRFRPGPSADAYAALWGGIFDWLAAERADRRAAVPDESVVRAGQTIRWRRGSFTDSVVRVLMRRRGPAAKDTLVMRFSATSALAESPPLGAGTYDVTVPGGRALLVVNASAELLPTRPRIRSGAVGRQSRADAARRTRSVAALYAVAVLLLCLEWILRRRAGLR